ncbi:transcription factor bHLH113-like [Phalaenopsis equestris]|uniref:transcription factor bHLH113-like n=1 Tax=Phalaenopsis equestris TaxID=78828 RepID=UPI0009E6255B|nr:transcription factor bHLH113-like [Phalaenopsis equestris]XP_020598678.1 transcription factor bHLH113-like [Phalaenopsis equestris]XP_020598679.1 transcription factor bHLH113-like [Phalaenopsis equestris]
MMMVTKMADQKRRNHYDPFLPTPKRLKNEALEGNGSLSHKEKKDKIGERVSALQQLVSPFGKSDTASVLTEATAYIKFLHDQIKVLSAPYLHSSPNDRLQSGSLRSRGLCLIPVAATVQIARSNGADIWAPTTN